MELGVAATGDNLELYLKSTSHGEGTGLKRKSKQVKEAASVRDGILQP